MRHFMVITWDINETKLHGPYELEKTAEACAKELVEDQPNTAAAYYPVELTIVVDA